MNRTLIILLLFATILQVGCSSSSNRPKELTSLTGLKSSSSSTENHGIRLSAIKDTARGIGSQAGLAWYSERLNNLIKSQKKNLDRIFNFNHLILNQNVLPPVLVEGRTTINMSDEFTIRISDHDYQIIQPPRFVTAPPTWSSYIWMNYKKPETPNTTLLPKNATERKTWNDYVHIGWNEGIEQANQIFTANLNRLKRDYNGMILYRKLLAQKMLSPPYVSQADLGVTGGGNDMRINDRVLRITAIPQLQANTDVWRPVISDSGKPKSNLLQLPLPLPRYNKKGKLK